MSYTLYIKADTPPLEERYRNHSHFHPGDSGIDLFVHEVEEFVDPDTRESQVVIDFGIQCEMRFQPVDQKEMSTNVSYMLFPRSSIVKTPYRMANGVGLIDSAYRGNIKAVVDNKRPGVLPKAGDRLFQLVTPDLRPMCGKLEVVRALSETSRGEGGFGSTGRA